MRIDEDEELRVCRIRDLITLVKETGKLQAYFYNGPSIATNGINFHHSHFSYYQ